MTRRLYVLAVLLLATSGHTAATISSNSRASTSPLAANAHFAIADFDGDAQPDVATVQVGRVMASHTCYWIYFQLSSGGRDFIGLTAPVGGLELALRDVNGDQNLDLIVTTSWLKQPVAVLLNDGHGNFRLRDPAGFAKAVSGAEASCSAAWTGVADDLAVFTRAVGDCDQPQSASTVPTLSGSLRFSFTKSFTRWCNLSVLGRGPPSSLLNDTFTDL